MALRLGIDYVFARDVTYTGKEGLGKGCLVGTHSILLQLPTLTTTGIGRSTATKRWCIGKITVREAVTDLLNDPELSHSDIDSSLRTLAQKVQGSELIDLATVRKLKIRSSVFSRGIYTCKNSSGSGWRGFPLKKDDALAFSIFYEGHPAAVGN